MADDFCQELLYRLRRSARGVPPGRDLLRSQIITYLTFLAEDPEVYRYLDRQVPTDRERSVTHHSGSSRLVADMGGLEAAASRWVEEPTCSADELSDRLTAGAVERLRLRRHAPPGRGAALAVVPLTG